MKYLSILEQSTKEVIRAFAEKKKPHEYLPETYQHPQEDYLIASNSQPVFVVSDDVTLNFKKLVEGNEKYLNPSQTRRVTNRTYEGFFGGS